MKFKEMTAVMAAVFATGSLWGAGGTGAFLRRPEAWFASEEAVRISGNILSWQSEEGGWPKNIDVTAQPFAGDRKDIRPTFDNGATTDELRFLARVYNATKKEHYRKAFVKGLDYILKAQYPTGGWPQFYPPGKQYHRHITFNDGAMVRLMIFLREIYQDQRYAFLDDPGRSAARKAFDRGVACILKCQIRVEGKLTAWCAQHDEIDLSPRPGRTYELASLSGSESVGIVRLLMSLDPPTPRVSESGGGAVARFRKCALHGIRVEKRDGDTIVVDDPSAPPLWARFYEIGTDRPIFCDRDGIPKQKLSDIGPERRNGYRWLGNWPQSLIEKEYPQWKTNHFHHTTHITRNIYNTHTQPNYIYKQDIRVLPGAGKTGSGFF